MFVKIKLLSKSHRHSGKCYNRDLLYTMPSFLFSFLCMMLVGNIFLTPILLVSGNAEDGFPDPNFSRRHHHRQQQRRSVSSNTGAPSNQIAISSEENEIHSNIVDNGQVQNLLGNSTGRPKVCSSCIDRELYRNLTLIEIKKDILKKLNMQHGPPQVSRKDVDEHMMGQIVDRYRTTHGHIDHYGGIQNDARRGGGFDDDNEFQAKQITILAQNRK